MLPTDVKKTITAMTLQRPTIVKYIHDEERLPYMQKRQQLITEMQRFHMSRDHPVFKDLGRRPVVILPLSAFMRLMDTDYFRMFQLFLQDPQNTKRSYFFHHAGFLDIGAAPHSIIFGKNGRNRGFISVYKLGGKYIGSIILKTTG